MIRYSCIDDGISDDVTHDIHMNNIVRDLHGSNPVIQASRCRPGGKPAQTKRQAGHTINAITPKPPNGNTLPTQTRSWAYTDPILASTPILMSSGIKYSWVVLETLKLLPLARC